MTPEGSLESVESQATVPPPPPKEAPVAHDASEYVQNEREAAEMALKANSYMSLARGFDRVGLKAQAEEYRAKADKAIEMIEKEMEEDGKLIQATVGTILSGLARRESSASAEGRVEIHGQLGMREQHVARLRTTPRLQRRFDRFSEVLGLREISSYTDNSAGKYHKRSFRRFIGAIDHVMIGEGPISNAPTTELLSLNVTFLSDAEWNKLVAEQKPPQPPALRVVKSDEEASEQAA